MILLLLDIMNLPVLCNLHCEAAAHCDIDHNAPVINGLTYIPRVTVRTL